MFLISILVIISMKTFIQCYSSSEYCLKEERDYEVNKFQSVFTIKDKVYIRVGSDVSKLWIYDTRTQEVQTDFILATQLFPDWGTIVEFVSAVICDNCPEKVSNLVIAIGRPDMRSYHTFATFRLQSDGSLVKIKGREELPPDWGLHNGEGEFSLDAPDYWGFFPRDVVTPAINYSNFHGFTFFPKEQLFSLKYYTEDRIRHFLYRQVLPDGVMTDWTDTGIIGEAHVLNSIFYIDDTLYAIDNDQQKWPKISHKITVSKEVNGDKTELIFNTETLDIDARNFFNCYETTTATTASTVTTTPVITTTTTTSTTPKTTTTVSTTTTTEITTTSMATTNETSVPIIPPIPEETTTELMTTSESSSSSTEEEEKVDSGDDDNTIFWIIFFVLLLLILLIIICAVFVFIYLRNKRKGNQHLIGSQEGSNEDSADSMKPLDGRQRPMISSSALSTTSLRSTHDKTIPKDVLGSPSMASIRSTHDKNQPINNRILLAANPSNASLRSNKH